MPDQETLLTETDVKCGKCKTSSLVEMSSGLLFDPGDECNAPEWRYHRWIVCTYCNRRLMFDEPWFKAELRKKKG